MTLWQPFQLAVINKNLETYYDAWDRFVDSWLIIKIKDPSCVYQWRLEVSVNVEQYVLAERTTKS